jgi:predicted RecB family endonuclease
MYKEQTREQLQYRIDQLEKALRRVHKFVQDVDKYGDRTIETLEVLRSIDSALIIEEVGSTVNTDEGSKDINIKDGK